MAESGDKSAKSAEAAYAAAVQGEPTKSAAATDDRPEKAAPAAAPSATAAPDTERSLKKKAANVPVTGSNKKPAASEPAAKSKPRRRPVRKVKPAVKAAPTSPISELKDKIMATAKTPDFTKSIAEAMSEMQARANATYEKSAELASEMTEFTKGNVEALVESGKILAGGMQDVGKTYADEAKAAYEALTTDMKEMAAVKSPTELFQLQGQLARRNFDTLVAYSSKNSEAMIKLASEAFAPISSRMSLAAEKISKAA